LLSQFGSDGGTEADIDWDNDDEVSSVIDCDVRPEIQQFDNKFW
jgi:hypothetical protein